MYQAIIKLTQGEILTFSTENPVQVCSMGFAPKEMFLDFT